MSILGKKPYVQEVLDTLTEQQLTTLAGLLDNPGIATNVALYGNENLLSEANKGVTYVNLKIDELSNKILTGYLLYTDTKCGFFGFGATEPLMCSYKINPTTRYATPIYENLSVEEFRRAIDDEQEAAPGGKDAWVESMKAVVNASNNNVHFSNTGFVELNKFKVNEITFQDTPEGETPAVKITNADLKIGAAGQTKKIYLNGVELSSPSSVTTETTGGATSVSLKFWVGTQAQYDSISTKDANTFYIVKA